MTAVWIVGESDDHIEAAFTTLEAAEAYLAKLRGDSNPSERTYYYRDLWWIEAVEIDPAEPGVRDPLRGLGGLGT